MQRRPMTPAEMRERSENLQRERQHLLRYAIWNSRRIREEREREEKAKAAAASPPTTPPKQASPKQASPKRLPLQPIHNTAVLNSRLGVSSEDANATSDDDTSSESSGTSASEPDSDDLEDLSDSFSKLERPVSPSLPTESCTERLSEAKVVDSGSSSDDGSSTDSASCSDDGSCSDDSDDSWFDCDDSDDGTESSCCVIKRGPADGYSDRDVAVFFKRVSKRFNAMITSVSQTRL